MAEHSRSRRPKRLETIADWAPYGIGEPDEHGIYPDYRAPNNVRPVPPDQDAPQWDWLSIFDNWPVIAIEIHEHYGVDVEVEERPWPWLYNRVIALAGRPGTRLHQIAFPHKYE